MKSRCERRSAAIGLLCLACAPGTGVVVAIDAEGASAGRAAVLEVRAFDEGGAEQLRREVDPGELPWRLLVTPAGDASRRWSIEASLRDEDAPFSAVHLEGRFEAGAVQQISLCFRDVCEDVACAVGSTCVDGACVPVEAAPRVPLGLPPCGDAECGSRQGGEPCAGGVCHAGGCCRGCWDGARCARGDALDACGAGGVACAACAAGQACDGACVAAEVTSFDVGARHACAIVAGQVYCWGDAAAAIGDAEAGAIRSPRRVALPPRRWVEVATGGASCARDEGGGLMCWGGSYGAPREALVLDPPARYTRVAVGAAFACGLRGDDGALVCEGSNDWGQLGALDEVGPVTVQSAYRLVGGIPEPLPDAPHAFASIAAGTEGAAALRVDSGAFWWGRLGRAGAGGALEPWSPPGPLLLDAAAEAVDVGKTSWHHACLLAPDGSLACGGANLYGEAGHEPLGPWEPFGPPSGGPGAYRAVSTGAQASCAVGADGSLHCWGRNDRGQLGGASPSASEPTPARVGDRTDWSEVQIWSGGCALTAAGELYCWGDNDVGQAGVGSTQEIVPSPTIVGFVQ